jgi:hypothetical protein
LTNAYKKEVRETIMIGLCHCYKTEGEVLLLVVIMWDEAKVHPFEPESKRLFKEEEIYGDANSSKNYGHSLSE